MEHYKTAGIETRRMKKRKAIERKWWKEMRMGNENEKWRGLERNRRKKEGGRAEDRIREEARVWLDTVCYFKSSDCCRGSNSNRCLIFSYFVSLLFSRSSLTTASTLLNHHNNKNQPGQSRGESHRRAHRL